MPTYQYTAIDDYGKKIEGIEHAETEKELETKLATRGYYLLSAEEVKSLVKVPPPAILANPYRRENRKNVGLIQVELRKYTITSMSTTGRHQRVWLRQLRETGVI